MPFITAVIIIYYGLIVSCQRTPYPLKFHQPPYEQIMPAMSNVPLIQLPFTSKFKKDFVTPNLNYMTQSFKNGPIFNGSYVILAPRIIRPGEIYYASINFKNIASGFKINLIIQKDGKDLLNKLVPLKQGKPVKVGLRIPKDLVYGDYKLIAQGQLNPKQLIFLNETKLEFQNKAASVFIETDKAIYSRGQTVRFRVIVTNYNLKPHEGLITISIYDSLQNKVVEKIDIELLQGVFSDSFTITKDTQVGDWTLSVQIQSFITKETVRVSDEECGLPKFQVFVECPIRALLGDTQLPVNVTAKYSFGKRVNGFVEITLRNADTDESTILPAMQFIDGEAHVNIPLKYVKVPEYANENDFIVTANVTDYLTGTYSYSSSSVILAQHSYIVEIIGAPPIFKPGLKYTSWIRIRTYDNKFIEEDNSSVNVFYAFDELNPDTWHNESFIVDSMGIIQLDLYPDNNTKVIVIKVDYKGDSAFWRIEDKQYSPSLKFLQLYTDAPNYVLGDTALLEINSSSSLNGISLVVLSRGSIQLVGEISLKSKRTAKINLHLTEVLIPEALAIIYYLTEDGELVLDTARFTVNGKLPSNITFDFYSSNGTILQPEIDTLSPGSEIIIKGQAPPHSYVAINAFDQMAYIMRTESFPSLIKIYNDLYAYGLYKPPNDLRHSNQPYKNPEEKFDSCRLLKSAGLAFITNGCTLHSNDENLPKYFIKSEDPDFLPKRLNRPFCSLELATFKNQSKLMRSYFPDTWLWLDKITGSDGLFENAVTVPDSMTTWRTSAYFMHGELGLGQSDKVIKTLVVQPFFVLLELPNSAVKNQLLKLEAIISYSGKEELQVTVTLEQSDQFKLADQISNNSYNKQIKIKSEGINKVFFNIIPLVYGEINFKIIASTLNWSDSEEQIIVVKPNGILKKKSDVVFIQRFMFRKQAKVSKDIYISLPNNSISETLTAKALIMGNPFAEPIKDLLKLIQNPLDITDIRQMLGNLAIFQYLISTNQTNPYLTSKLKNQLNNDLDFLLWHKNKDGSFYKDGKNLNITTVYTALALQYLAEVSQYINLDVDIITRTQNWFIKKQRQDGSFGMRDSSEQMYMDVEAHAESATAEVLIALLSSKFPNERPEIIKANKFIENSMNNSLEADVYVKCLYALTLVNSSLVDEDLNKIEKIYNLDYLYSMQKLNRAEIRIYTYIMLIYMNKGEISKALQLAKYISINMKIGLYIPLEYSRALFGLSHLAQLAYSPDTVAHVEISANHNAQVMEIDLENVNLVNDFEIPGVSNNTKLMVKAQGSGALLIEVLWEYYENVVLQWNPIFNLDISTRLNISSVDFTIIVCSSYINEEKSINGVGIEVKLPYGFSIIGLKRPRVPNLVYLFQKYASNHIIFKLSELTTMKLCFEIKANMTEENGNTISSTVYALNKPAFKEEKSIQINKRLLRMEDDSKIDDLTS